MANEAALRCPSTRIRLSVYHSMHPSVQQFMLQNGLIMGGSAVDCGVTQEQLENRKCKMAQLEKIHSKLSKSKMASTPGAATVAALQQQQLYAAAAAAGGQMPRSLPPLSSVQVLPIQRDQRKSFYLNVLLTHSLALAQTAAHISNCMSDQIASFIRFI